MSNENQARIFDRIGSAVMSPVNGHGDSVMVVVLLLLLFLLIREGREKQNTVMTALTSQRHCT